MSSFPLPTVTPPTLSSFQMSYNGLKIGSGTAYAILRAEGLDLPNVRNGDVARPRDTGEFIGLDLIGGRDITLTLDATTDGTSLQHALTALAAAFIPPSDAQTENQLWLQLPNLPLLSVGCRVRRRQLPIDLPWSSGNFASSIVIALHATDPRVYGPSVGAGMVLPSVTTSGATFPATFPLTFGGGTSPGSIACNNTGNIEMRPIITIVGPVTTPTVTNATTGLSLTFTNPEQTSYTLNNQDQLVIDLDSHEITYYPHGSTVGSSRRSWLVPGSTWWDLPPGTASTIAFTSQDATLPSPVPTVTVDYAPAFVSAT